MSTIIICPKCYFHKHFTMTRDGYLCPICGRRMVERSFEDIKFNRLTSDDLRDEDERLFR